jgi:hypothetical protein
VPERFLSALAFSLLFFTIGAVILVASMSPWLFSRMDILATRHVLPWYLFLCAATVGFVSLLLKPCPAGIAKWAPTIALLLIVLPVTVVQNRLSMLEVVVTGSEIQAMRSRIFEWVDKKGWIDNRYLLVVRPANFRPVGIEDLVNDTKYGMDNAVMASSINPVSIPWMVNALLRERRDHPAFQMVDCAFDQACANGWLQDPKKIVLGYTNGIETIKTAVEPFVINLSALTSNAVNPSIVRGESPSISVSSTLGDLAPFGLLSSGQPGWHAERHPRYPQTISIDFKEVESIGNLGLLPQDGHVARMPKIVRIKLSNDGKSWTTAASSENICEANEPEGWHGVKLPEPLKARFLQIDILSNCGDPAYLTLRGLRVE